MTGDNLPDDHHIVRYAKPSLVEGEAVDGSAFLLRPDEPGLSVNWLEAFGGNDENHQLSEVRRLFRLKLSRNGGLRDSGTTGRIGGLRGRNVCYLPVSEIYVSYTQ